MNGAKNHELRDGSCIVTGIKELWRRGRGGGGAVDGEAIPLAVRVICVWFKKCTRYLMWQKYVWFGICPRSCIDVSGWFDVLHVHGVVSGSHLSGVQGVYGVV